MRNALRVVAVVAIIGVLLFLMNESNFVENKFASFKEVKAARPGAKFGVPDWLPESSREIVHVHNLDTSKFMVRFEMPEGANVVVPAECRRIQPSELLAPPMSRDWWPNDIPQVAQSFYRCKSGQFVALSRSAGYVWGTP